MQGFLSLITHKCHTRFGDQRTLIPGVQSGDEHILPAQSRELRSTVYFNSPVEKCEQELLECILGVLLLQKG